MLSLSIEINGNNHKELTAQLKEIITHLNNGETFIDHIVQGEKGYRMAVTEDELVIESEEI